MRDTAKTYLTDINLSEAKKILEAADPALLGKHEFFIASHHGYSYVIAKGITLLHTHAAELIEDYERLIRLDNLESLPGVNSAIRIITTLGYTLDRARLELIFENASSLYHLIIRPKRLSNVLNPEDYVIFARLFPEILSTVKGPFGKEVIAEIKDAEGILSKINHALWLKNHSETTTVSATAAPDDSTISSPKPRAIFADGSAGEKITTAFEKAITDLKSTGSASAYLYVKLIEDFTRLIESDSTQASAIFSYITNQTHLPEEKIKILIWIYTEQFFELLKLLKRHGIPKEVLFAKFAQTIMDVISSRHVTKLKASLKFLCKNASTSKDMQAILNWLPTCVFSASTISYSGESDNIEYFLALKYLFRFLKRIISTSTADQIVNILKVTPRYGVSLVQFLSETKHSWVLLAYLNLIISLKDKSLSAEEIMRSILSSIQNSDLLEKMVSGGAPTSSEANNVLTFILKYLIDSADIPNDLFATLLGSRLFVELGKVITHSKSDGLSCYLKFLHKISHKNQILMGGNLSRLVKFVYDPKLVLQLVQHENTELFVDYLELILRCNKLSGYCHAESYYRSRTIINDYQATLNTVRIQDRENNFDVMDLILNRFGNNAHLLYLLIRSSILHPDLLAKLSSKADTIIQYVCAELALELALSELVDPAFRSILCKLGEPLFKEESDVPLRDLNSLPKILNLLASRLSTELNEYDLRNYFHLLQLVNPTHASSLVGKSYLISLLLPSLGIKNKQGWHFGMLVVKHRELLSDYLTLLAEITYEKAKQQLKEILSMGVETSVGYISFASLICEEYKDDPAFLLRIAQADLLNDTELLKLLVTYLTATKRHDLPKEFKFTCFPKALAQFINSNPNSEILHMLLCLKDQVTEGILIEVNEALAESSSWLEGAIGMLEDALGFNSDGTSIATEKRSPICQYLYTKRGTSECTPDSGSLSRLHKKWQELKIEAALPLSTRLKTSLITNTSSTLFGSVPSAVPVIRSLNDGASSVELAIKP